MKSRPTGTLQNIDYAEWCQKVPSGQFAVVDVETTGLNAATDRVIEIAIIRCEADGTIIDEWSTLVNPKRDPGATHIHGITAEDLQDAPSFKSVSNDILERLSGSTVCAHNLAFDSAFLQAEFNRAKSDHPRNDGLCTMLLARFLFPGLPSYSLSNCAAHFDIEVFNAHRALADTRVTQQVLTRLLTELPRPLSE